MPSPSTVCEGAMLLIAFVVALAIAVFLIVTLMRPEQF
ncbi:potassium-transporting ATPase subunit F [Devosia chinhatensis]